MTLRAPQPAAAGVDGVTGALGTSFEDARELARRARERGGQVAVIQGLGFVGAAVAAVVAGARDEAGAPRFLVLGVDLASPAGRAKIEAIRAGRSPIVSPDPELDALIRRGALEDGNLHATTDPRVYGLADVIVVDVHLDVIDRAVDDPAAIEVDLAGFESALRAVGREMGPDALVLVETTVPLGACERVARPALEEERAARGIDAPLRLAHAYERVMPGPRYVDSIRRFWRTVSAVDDASLERARAFLSAFIDTETHPLRTLARPAASEMAKLLENAYRAVNIAFIHEWTLLAERAGVDLFDVVDSIRVRKGTHDNIRQPGFGVGGYCLTKDALFAQWAARELFDSDLRLDLTLRGLAVNYDMPLHTLALTEEVLGGSLKGRRLLLCGVSYLPEVGDTRNSPSELFVAAARRAGAEVVAHDPYVAHWEELPDVELLGGPAPEGARFDAVVAAVGHPDYGRLSADAWRALGGAAGPPAIVDAANVVGDAMAEALRERGCRVIGVGKGHWRDRGYHQA